MPNPSTRITAALVAAAVVAVLIGAALALGVLGGNDEAGPRVVASSPGSSTPEAAPPTRASPAPAETSPTSPGSPSFPTADCQPLTAAPGGALGVGIPRPARLAAQPEERAALASAIACLRAVGGAAPVLRTQLPIDVTRRTGPEGNERAELDAFAALLRDQAAPGIVSIRAHDFSRCGRRGAPAARERAELAAGEALQPCEFPTPTLFRQLFTEVTAALKAAAPEAQLTFTAWNEPDHPAFTLLDGLGLDGAARRAGAYWTQAAEVVGADRVLAGEFADQSLATLLRLRTAFVEGTGGVAPPAWAIHPYRDLTAPAAEHVTTAFEQAVAPAPVWLTEVGARLSGKRGISDKPGAQRARGETLRSRLERTPTRVILYLLTPPPAPQNRAQDGWDSAIADRSGRARPFLCGLAALAVARCPGNPAAFGT